MSLVAFLYGWQLSHEHSFLFATALDNFLLGSDACMQSPYQVGCNMVFWASELFQVFVQGADLVQSVRVHNGFGVDALCKGKRSPVFRFSPSNTEGLHVYATRSVQPVCNVMAWHVCSALKQLYSRLPLPDVRHGASQELEHKASGQLSLHISVLVYVADKGACLG